MGLSRKTYHRTHVVEATYAFEIELALTGTFQPGYAQTGPTYDCGGEPGCDDSVEDADIADIGIVERDHGRGRWITRSLLDGVDRKSEAYQQIVRNILAFIGDDAELALVEAAAE